MAVLRRRCSTLQAAQWRHQHKPNANNRLSVAAASSLFTHGSDHHRLAVNKANEPDTASIVFQSAFSSRAEFGIVGDNDFHMKVSADGNTWHEGLVIDKNNGAVSFPNTTLSVNSTDIAAVVLTSGSGTYTPGPDVKCIKVMCLGGGGAGAYTNSAVLYLLCR